MKQGNAKQTGSSYLSLNVYDLILIALIAVTVLLIAIIWIWYGYKDAQIENELLLLK